MYKKIVPIVVSTLAISLAACGPILPSSVEPGEAGIQQGETMQSSDDPVSSAPTDGTPIPPELDPQVTADSSGGGISGSPGSETEEPTGWETYVDSELGFKIDYPQSYTPVVNPEREPGSGPTPVHQVQFQEVLGDIELVQFDIEVFENSDGVSLEEWLDENAPDGSREQVTIGNTTGYLITLIIEIAPNQFYYLADDSHIYKLTPMGPYAQEILDSFTLPE